MQSSIKWYMIFALTLLTLIHDSTQIHSERVEWVNGVQKRIYYRDLYNVNEDDIYGTCTGTCRDGGDDVMDDFKRSHNCDVVSSCFDDKERSIDGWLRWFVMCDYCVCGCERHEDM